MQLPDLKEYAINYLSRYSNTEAGLVQLLRRKVQRWIKTLRQEVDGEKNGIEHQQVLQAAYERIDQIVKEIKDKGMIDDETFVSLKIPSLIRAGYSKKLIQNCFLQKKVKNSLIEASLQKYSEEDTELLSAIAYVRKRKIGPFRREMLQMTSEIQQKEQMILARRGFSFTISEQVLSMSRSEAERYMDKVRSL